MDEEYDDETVNERIGEDIDYEESNANPNAKAQNPNISEDASKLAYREAINSFYKYKNAYEDAYNKMKNKIINNTELSWKEKRAEFQKIKPKCINCKRPVGSIFTIKQNKETLVRDLHAMCGDRQDPCRFSIEIVIPYTTTYNDTLKIDRDDIKDYKNEIIKYKNDIILDPFTGSGTTLKVAKEMGRNYIGYELYESYKEIIDKNKNSALIYILKVDDEVYKIGKTNDLKNRMKQKWKRAAPQTKDQNPLWILHKCKTLHQHLGIR